MEMSWMSLSFPEIRRVSMTLRTDSETERFSFYFFAFVDEATSRNRSRNPIFFFKNLFLWREVFELQQSGGTISGILSDIVLVNNLVSRPSPSPSISGQTGCFDEEDDGVTVWSSAYDKNQPLPLNHMFVYTSRVCVCVGEGWGLGGMCASVLAFSTRRSDKSKCALHLLWM